MLHELRLVPLIFNNFLLIMFYVNMALEVNVVHSKYQPVKVRHALLTLKENYNFSMEYLLFYRSFLMLHRHHVNINNNFGS